MWLGQKDAVDASPSYVTSQSPGKKEMAAYISKRRDKEEKIDVFIVSALGGVKKREGCRTPIKSSGNKRTCAMQTERLIS